MKTRIMIKNLQFGLMALFLMMISASGYSQACPGTTLQMSMTNIVTTATTIEFDVVTRNTSANSLKVTATAWGVTFPVGLITAGSTITFSVVEQPSTHGFTNVNITTIAYQAGTRQFRFNHPPVQIADATVLPSNTDKKFGRFRITSSLPFPQNYTTTFTQNPTGGALQQCAHTAYCAIPPAAYNPNSYALNPTTGMTLGGPYSFVVNADTCPTGSLTSQTAVTCFGGSNGTATVTLTGSATSASYTVDGGASTPATLVGNAFTVTGLTAGAHNIVVTTNGPCTLANIPVTITGPSGPLTNTTTESACGSYFWAVTGQTYTESGSYPGTTTNGNGCTVNETLDLTITPSTTTGSETVDACGSSYTWAVNGETYFATGAYTHTVGCNTATLTLTLTPSTTNGSMSQTACDSYTWTAGNGNTYTESGVYTHTVGCNTATLTLTITPSTTNGNLTETACGSYTWTAGNGNTYTESGVYTHVTGCNTATLTLTINASSVAYYADTDGDGFGAGAPTFSCTGNPGGMVLNNTDCAPANPLAWQNGSFYVDADNDGYYNGNPEATTVCYGNTVPSGYTASIVGTDCDDANANANPNHVEIAGNGIDDNCDGATDEVGPAIVIVVSQCGVTLANIANTIYSNQAAGAQGYRFEVTNGANVRTYDSATNSFSLLNLPGGAAYGTTYAIRVAVKTNGFWRAYSTPCNVTTPAQPATTNVVASQCGATLANMSTLIYCNQVTAANQYRFEVTNGANVRTYETSVNRFALTNLVGGGVYGTTYSVRVALRFGTTWEGYGTACNVTAPATPGISSLIASQCGITINNRWTTLYANQIADAQGYRFEVTNGATVRYYNTSVNRFALANLAGGVAPSTVYTVRVAVLYNAVYGDFGSPCNVTTAGVITRQAENPVTVFTVRSYPNPFADTFKLDINTSSEENVSVKVYDMIGKLVESRDIKSTEIGTQEVGSRFSSGVYNVIVSQGANVETLRVIKR